MATFLTPAVLALCLWTVSAFVGVPSGDLRIGGNFGVETSVTVPSRNGCREILRCTGNGTNLEWRRIGSRRPVMMVEGNKFITTMMRETGTPGKFAFTSYLTFDPIEIGDAGMWKCTIDSQSYTADISIEAELVSPMPSRHNLSDFFIGENLAVLCPVATCLLNITVHLVRSGEVMQTQRVPVPEGETPQFNLPVDERLAGDEYACRVIVNDFAGVERLFEEAFEITGTPKPKPVTTPTPTKAGEGKGEGQSALYMHTHTLTLGLVVLLLAIFLY